MTRSDFPAVASLLDDLGRMRPDELAHGVQARYLHHELTIVLGIAETALNLHKMTPPAPVIAVEARERMAELRKRLQPRTGDMIDLVDAERRS